MYRMLKVIVKNYGIYSDLTRSHKIKSTFYNESTLGKLLSKPKDRVAAKDKNNIFYENDCSNCEAVYFGKSKRYLKSRSDEHKNLSRIAIVKRMKLLNTVRKQITTLAGIRRKLLIEKVKETIRS